MPDFSEVQGYQNDPAGIHYLQIMGSVFFYASNGTLLKTAV